MANLPKNFHDDGYERDFFAWTVEQARILRGRAHNRIDRETIAEEIESLGRSEKNQVVSRMGVLRKNLVKWQFGRGDAPTAGRGQLPSSAAL